MMTMWLIIINLHFVFVTCWTYMRPLWMLDMVKIPLILTYVYAYLLSYSTINKCFFYITFFKTILIYSFFYYTMEIPISTKKFLTLIIYILKNTSCLMKG